MLNCLNDYFFLTEVFFLFCPSLFAWVVVSPFYLANLQFLVKTFQLVSIFFDFSNYNSFRMN